MDTDSNLDSEEDSAVPLVDLTDVGTKIMDRKRLRIFDQITTKK